MPGLFLTWLPHTCVPGTFGERLGNIGAMENLKNRKSKVPRASRNAKGVEAAQGSYRATYQRKRSETDTRDREQRQRTATSISGPKQHPGPVAGPAGAPGRCI